MFFKNLCTTLDTSSSSSIISPGERLASLTLDAIKSKYFPTESISVRCWVMGIVAWNEESTSLNWLRIGSSLCLFLVEGPSPGEYNSAAGCGVESLDARAEGVVLVEARGKTGSYKSGTSSTFSATISSTMLSASIIDSTG